MAEVSPGSRVGHQSSLKLDAEAVVPKAFWGGKDVYDGPT